MKILRKPSEESLSYYRLSRNSLDREAVTGLWTFPAARESGHWSLDILTGRRDAACRVGVGRDMSRPHGRRLQLPFHLPSFRVVADVFANFIERIFILDSMIIKPVSPSKLRMAVLMTSFGDR